MNLLQTIDLYCGGPGSGPTAPCPQCGPGKGGSLLLRSVRRTFDLSPLSDHVSSDKDFSGWILPDGLGFKLRSVDDTHYVALTEAVYGKGTANTASSQAMDRVRKMVEEDGLVRVFMMNWGYGRREVDFEVMKPLSADQKVEIRRMLKKLEPDGINFDLPSTRESWGGYKSGTARTAAEFFNKLDAEFSKNELTTVS